MRSEAGTYALIFRCRTAATVEVGRLGPVALEPGYYVYVGSAFGPGGVKARVERHWREDRRTHWHIDYLRENLVPLEAWYRHDGSRDEHRWARIFRDEDGVSTVPGFGASDCRCGSHLFYRREKPSLTAFVRTAKEDIRAASPG